MTGILRIDRTLSDAELEAIKRTWEQAYRGTQHAGETVFLDTTFTDRESVFMSLNGMGRLAPQAPPFRGSYSDHRGFRALLQEAADATAREASRATRSTVLLLLYILALVLFGLWFR